MTYDHRIHIFPVLVLALLHGRLDKLLVPRIHYGIMDEPLVRGHIVALYRQSLDKVYIGSITVDEDLFVEDLQKRGTRLGLGDHDEKETFGEWLAGDERSNK